MSANGPRSLFRPEALAYHERGLGPGNLVRYPAWVRWGYWLVVLAVAAAVVAAVDLRVTRSLRGPAEAGASSGEVVLTVPASGHPPIQDGWMVTVRAASTEVRGHVLGVSPGPAPATLAVEVKLDRPLGPGVEVAGDGVVQLPAERLAVVLLPGLRRLLGD